MPNRDLLEQIWDGKIFVPKPYRKSRFALAIEARMVVETISLSVAGGRAGPRIFADSHELMPALPLGDVLTEELGIEVPYGAFIVLEGTEFAAASTIDEQHIEWMLDVGLIDLAAIAGTRLPQLGHVAPGRDVSAQHVQILPRDALLGQPPGFRDQLLNAQFFDRRQSGARGSSPYRAAE